MRRRLAAITPCALALWLTLARAPAPAVAATAGPADVTCVAGTPGGAAFRGSIDACVVTTMVALSTGSTVTVHLVQGTAPADEGTVGCLGEETAAYATGGHANSGGAHGVGYGCDFRVDRGSVAAGAQVGRLDIHIPADAHVGQRLRFTAGACGSSGTCDPPFAGSGVYQGGPVSVMGPGATVAAEPQQAGPPVTSRAGSSAAEAGGGTLAHPHLFALTATLPTPRAALTNVVGLVVSATVAIIVVLFITFPAQLFNRTLDENYDEIRSLLRRRLPGWVRKKSIAQHPRAREATEFAAVLVVGAVLGSLLDPAFGINASSLATFLSLLGAIALAAAIAAVAGIVYRGARRHRFTARLRAIPAGLAVAALCVVVSRLTSFSPGYLYGVVCGVAFGGALTEREDGHVAAISAAAALAVAVLAWVAWTSLHDASTQTDAGFGLVVIEDFLGAVFVTGLVGTVITLFPLRFLPGWALARWNRPLWGAMFAIAVFILVQVMLQPGVASSRATRGAMATAITLFVAFGSMSIAFRWYSLRWRSRRDGPT